MLLLRRCGEPRASAGPCRWWRYISSPLRFHVFLARAHHQGPPKVNMWEDPLSPSKWKEEPVQPFGPPFTLTLNRSPYMFPKVTLIRPNAFGFSASEGSNTNEKTPNAKSGSLNKPLPLRKIADPQHSLQEYCNHYPMTQLGHENMNHNKGDRYPILQFWVKFDSPTLQHTEWHGAEHHISLKDLSTGNYHLHKPSSISNPCYRLLVQDRHILTECIDQSPVTSSEEAVITSHLIRIILVPMGKRQIREATSVGVLQISEVPIKKLPLLGLPRHAIQQLKTLDG
ncbi:hypothetical protein C4D60_Mb05t27980 [Musa balbisiana]|uniref:Uncharacterized protein n=1 Tax=Musa balbisiana TaxID=52838 RepID=A0A4S8JZG8_MUSBA|nr:hypothetical protein C4D60_Mb05t27980 [Musa balbisiana]